MSEHPAGQPALTHLYVYLTDGCNLACRHCWISPRVDETGRAVILPVEIFKAVVQEAKPLGLASVKLTGGEPLLHPEFLRCVEIAKTEGLALVVETNGLLCTPAVAAAIADVPHRSVSVSIDGADAATHDWLRGVAGAFEQAVQAVRTLATFGISPQVIFTVTRRNAHQIDAVVSLAEEIGASSVKFNIVQPAGRATTMQQNGETVSVRDIIALGRHVETELAPRTRMPLFFDYPMAFRSLSRIARGNGCSVCSIHGIIGLLPTGQYALCDIGRHVPELVFGTAGRDRLAEIWRDHPVIATVREGLPAQLTGICGRCLMKWRCLGCCIAQNYYSSGNLLAPYWFCKEAEREGLFPLSRLAVPPTHPACR